MTLDVLATVGGLVILAVAAEHFVMGAARLALTLRLRPVIVGAVVIGFGTSLPELIVSALAAGQGSLDLAIANVSGSNIANVTLVLGMAALVRPLATEDGVLRREAPIATVSVCIFAVVLIGGLQRYEGLILLAALGVALAYIVHSELSSRETEDEVKGFTDVERMHPVRLEVIRTIVGMAGTAAGAQLLVGGARGIAEGIGVSEGIIGLTLVAVGTSLPEIATVVQAARRHHTELIIGNVLGSNMFNSLAVGGVVALVGPGSPVDQGVLGRAAVFMVIVMFGSWLLLATGRRLVRAEGALLLAAYGVGIALSAA